MARSRIKINGTTATYGTVPIGAGVTLTNDGDGDELAFAWVTLFEPPGTSDPLTGAGTSSATFTPTKEGSYLLRLTVDGSFSSTAIVTVFDARSGERFPAAFETLEAGAAGWTGAINHGLAKALHQSTDGPIQVVVTPGGISAGHIVRLAGSTTVNGSTQASFAAPTIAATPATSKVLDRVGILIDGVTPGDVASGHLVIVRWFGLVSITGSGSPTVGDPVYLSDVATPALTPGTVLRVIGRVVQASGGSFQWTIDAPPPGLDPLVLSVREAPFSAKGDGVTDDRPAFKAAIAAAATAGATLFVPPGTYMLTREPGFGYGLLLSGLRGVTIQGTRGKSVLKVVNNIAGAAIVCQLMQITNCRQVSIRDMIFDGNWGNAATTIAAASDGATLPQSTINVADTTGFPSSGAFKIILPSGAQRITYTGKTSTTFTGCVGGTGVLRGDGDLGRQGYVVGYYDVGHTHVTVPSDGATLPQSTINVADTTVFPPSGSISITTQLSGEQVVAYTGKTSTTFTGCTGGTGVIHTGNFVWDPANGLNQVSQRDAQNRLLFCYGVGGDNVDLEISNCHFRQAYGDAIWFGGDGTTGGQSDSVAGARSVVVQNCTFDMMARNGITLSSACDDVTIRGCRFRNIFTTAIDTEPVGAGVTNVVVDDVDAGLWWNPAHDPGLNVFSIQGGVTGTPAPWNYAAGYRVLNSVFRGSVLIFDAVDVLMQGCKVICDFDSVSGAPIEMESFVDDVRIVDCYLYGRSGAVDVTNRGVINLNRLALVANAAVQPAGVLIRGCAIHARGGMDGIFIEGTGGGDGASGTASATTATTLTDSSATWTASQWIGHTVTSGGLQGVVTSNTSTVLTLATWHLDGAHGWTDVNGQPSATPAPGAYVIQAVGGIVTVESCDIDCGASDGRTAGRHGINVATSDAGGPDAAPNLMRVQLLNNRIHAANPHAIHVFLYSAPAIRYLEIRGNHAWDNQPAPTTTHLISFSNNAGFFDPTTQVSKLIMRDNSAGVGVRVALDGIDQGYWLEADGPTWQLLGFGSPQSAIAAPIGSTFRRLDGTAGGVLWVKETSDVAVGGSAHTNRSGDVKSTDQTLTLDAVTTSAPNCLVIQMLVATPGSGSSTWDQWTNSSLVGFAEIFQDNNSGAETDTAAAAGVMVAAGTSTTGTVRQHASPNEFGNGTYTIALTPQVPGVAPQYVTGGTKVQGATGSISVAWPAHVVDDVGMLVVVVSEGDTATVSDPFWAQAPNSPTDGAFTGVGARLHVFLARARRSGDGLTTGMPAVSVGHSGANIMARIHLLRGCTDDGNTGWAAK